MQTLERRSGGRDPGRHLVVSVACATLLLGLAGCGDSEPPSAQPAAAAPSASASAPSAAAPSGPAVPAPEAPATPADTAWAAFQEKFDHPPEPPAAWATEQPDEAAVAAFQRERGAAAVTVAEAAKAFYTTHKDDPRAAQARVQEMQLLEAASQMGLTNVLERLVALKTARAGDPGVSEDERFEMLMGAGHHAAQLLLPQGMPAARAALRKTAEDLVRQFPQREEPYRMLLSLVSDAPPEEALAVARSLTSTNVPESARTAAQTLLSRLESVGKPLALKFTAVDGRDIDLAALRGKVVLIDFWATWCGPCIAELPNVKQTYEKLNPKGFEILGISFDQDQGELEEFVKREKMPWPQYFDGKGWGNAFGQRFGIEGIPTMWLVDKKGILRDLNGRDDLEAKVERLLAEESGPATL